MANGLRGLLSKVSSHDKKTFTLSLLASRKQTESPLPVSQGQNAESLQELKEKRVARHQKLFADTDRAHGFILGADMLEFSSRPPQTHVCAHRMDQHIPAAFKKRFPAKYSCLLSLTAF